MGGGGGGGILYLVTIVFVVVLTVSSNITFHPVFISVFCKFLQKPVNDIIFQEVIYFGGKTTAVLAMDSINSVMVSHYKTLIFVTINLNLFFVLKTYRAVTAQQEQPTANHFR